MTLLRHSRLDSSCAITNQNSDVAAKITAESLLHWKPSGLPLITLKNAATKVLKAKRHAVFCEKRTASFLLELKTQFDISAKDALKIITTTRSFYRRIKKRTKTSIFYCCYLPYFLIFHWQQIQLCTIQLPLRSTNSFTALSISSAGFSYRSAETMENYSQKPSLVIVVVGADFLISRTPSFFRLLRCSLISLSCCPLALKEHAVPPFSLPPSYLTSILSWPPPAPLTLLLQPLC